MSLATARELFGVDAVDRALAEHDYAPVTRSLASEVSSRADPPGAFRAWALSQPWPRFCAIVRIVSGEVRREVKEA